MTKHLFAGQEGKFSYTYENEKKRASFTTNELTGWKIAGTMYDKEVAGAVSGIRNTVILVISISILAALAIILFNIRSIIKPISALTLATERISKGICGRIWTRRRGMRSAISAVTSRRWWTISAR